jgi:hypothetical protein
MDWMAQAAGYWTPRYLTFKHALELADTFARASEAPKSISLSRAKSEDADYGSPIRLVPMMREYTVFNVDQCENLPDSVKAGKPLRVRNPDTRGDPADEFLRSTGADYEKATVRFRDEVPLRVASSRGDRVGSSRASCTTLSRMSSGIRFQTWPGRGLSSSRRCRKSRPPAFRPGRGGRARERIGERDANRLRAGPEDGGLARRTIRHPLPASH